MKTGKCADRRSAAYIVHLVLSTGFGSGFFPLAPGTAGAVVAWALWYAAACFLSPETLFCYTLAAVILTTLVGCWSAGYMERYWGEDPRRVVIDEWVGCWIPMLAATGEAHRLWFSLLGLGLFRLIDITKPLGCRWIDRNVRGGLGIMLDDVMAGLYAFGIVWLISYFAA